jgi:CHAT domain-containing protein
VGVVGARHLSLFSESLGFSLPEAKHHLATPVSPPDLPAAILVFSAAACSWPTLWWLRSSWSSKTRSIGSSAAPASQAEGARPFAHPYYWSAFILLGDPD